MYAHKREIYKCASKVKINKKHRNIQSFEHRLGNDLK